MRHKKTRCITINSPAEYGWQGKKLLHINDIDKSRRWSSVRKFRTTKKAFNVLRSISYPILIELYREYWRGQLVQPRIEFNCVEALEEHIRLYPDYCNSK